MEKFDIVVIGAGPGGYPAAIRAAQLGASVAVVEREVLGGTCLNWGCIPTKTLIASAELYAHMRKAGQLGVRAESVGFDYAAMAERKNKVVGTLRSGVEQLLAGNGVKVFTGAGSFLSRNRVDVKAKGRSVAVLEARRTIVATGAEPVVPGFLPAHDRVLDSRRFLDLTSLPSSMIVLGGGVIGCEFACMAAQLGVEVTVAEMLEDILLVLDRDVRRALRRHMEQELGIRVLTGNPLEQIQAGKGGVEGTAGGERVRGDLLLAAVGRKPVTQGLALDRAGIVTTEYGAVPIDAFCRTRAASVYAIGDVTEGTTQLAHAATSQGVTAAENALRGKQVEAESLVPACIFTTPEIGSVGLSEDGAKALGKAVKVGKFVFSALGKAMAAGETEGFVKWLADPDTDRLLGAHAVGPHATDLISEAAVAVRAELTAEEAGRTIHCHPTFSEAWMEAAHAVHDICIHQPPRRKK